MHRLIIRCPNPLGDQIMSTPALRAVRKAHPQAEITLLAPPATEELFAGSPWYDRFIALPAKTEGRKKSAGLLRFAKTLKQLRFDSGLLLTNSFSSAFLFWVAGIPERIGYARDGRTWLLTQPVKAPPPAEESAPAEFLEAPPPSDRLLPIPRGWTNKKLEALRRTLKHPPSPMEKYYLTLVEAVGVKDASHDLTLGLTAGQQDVADRLLIDEGCDWRKHRLVLIAPGAGFGSSKLWTVDGFAKVADAVSERYQARVGILGGPGEETLVRGIVRAAKRMHAGLFGPKISLGLLKGYCRRASLFVGTDAGARHVASAFGVPSVILMGPTDPRWSAGNARRTVILREPVACAPCHLKTCPIDHRCLELITPERVMAAVERVMTA